MILFDFIINNEHPSLPGHFPNNPIVPGAIIIEKVIQKLSELETPKEVTTLLAIKFIKPILPNQKVTIGRKIIDMLKNLNKAMLGQCRSF
jgi:3-hydroxymyristoyl/3-hydroxydecanoyl-(acyl carrier protein) dehydratase